MRHSLVEGKVSMCILEASRCERPVYARSERRKCPAGRMNDDRCPEATCRSEPQRDRQDRRCYYHGKIWDGLIERMPRKKGGAPREFLDAGGGRLVQIQ
jgi:hypothetical protein